MLWFCVLLLFPVFSFTGIAQTDSLRQRLQQAKGTERIRILLTLSSTARHNDIKKAINRAKEALAIARRLEQEDLASKSLQKLGFFYMMDNRDTTALKYYLKALNIERLHGHREREADVLHNLGRFYANQGNYTKGLRYYFQALRIRQNLDNKKAAAMTMSYIGNAYLKRNEFKQAISYYKQAAEIGKTTHDLRIIAICEVKAAINLHKLGHFNKAESYFKQALEAAKNMKSLHAQAGILLAMSEAYEKQNLHKKAETLNKKVLQMAREQHNKILQARSYENLAGIYAQQGHLKQSNQYYLKSIKVYKAMGFTVLPVVAKLMQNLLQSGQPQKAIQTGKQALKITKDNSLQNKKKVLKVLVNAYRQTGDYQKALQTQKHLTKIDHQIYSQEKSKQIAEMQTRFDMQKKEQEIKLLHKKQEKNRLSRNALLAGLVLVLIIGFLIYNRQRLKINKNKIALENIHLKEKQMQQDLEFKNKQLTTHSLHLVQKNEVMKELKERIAQLQSSAANKTGKDLKSLGRLVDYSFNLDKDWEEFKLYFEEVHSGFYDLLKKEYSDLTSNELRLSALVKLNLTIKEISTILNISPDSVKTARYRLRKKLGLKTEVNLSDFLYKIDQKATSATS